MRKIDSTTLRRWIVGGLAVSVLAIASGFSSCNTNTLLPIFGPVNLSPTSLSFGCPAASTPAPFTATETNFTGTFSAMSNNTAVATVASTSPPGTFLVTPVSNSNMSTTITVTGGGGTTANLNVTVLGCPCVRHRDMWSH